MDGKQLYEQWGFEMEQQSVGTDEWEDLDESEQVAWNALAEFLKGYFGR